LYELIHVINFNPLLTSKEMFFTHNLKNEFIIVNAEALIPRRYKLPATMGRERYFLDGDDRLHAAKGGAHLPPDLLTTNESLQFHQPFEHVQCLPRLRVRRSRETTKSLRYKGDSR
jgi:hypothetical protein